MRTSHNRDLLLPRFSHYLNASLSKEEYLVDIRKDTLKEWVADLFLYTDDLIGPVVLRILYLYLESDLLITQTLYDFHSVIQFLNVDKEPQAYPNDEDVDDWPEGRLSMIKKQKFSHLSHEEVGLISDWLIYMTEIVLDEYVAKDLRSASGYWARRVTACD